MEARFHGREPGFLMFPLLFVFALFLFSSRDFTVVLALVVAGFLIAAMDGTVAVLGGTKNGKSRRR
jgi:hypothetical protein